MRAKASRDAKRRAHLKLGGQGLGISSQDGSNELDVRQEGPRPRQRKVVIVQNKLAALPRSRGVPVNAVLLAAHHSGPSVPVRAPQGVPPLLTLMTTKSAACVKVRIAGAAPGGVQRDTIEGNTNTARCNI